MPEQWYAIIDSATGGARSFASVVADPLPEGLEAVAIDHQPGAGEYWDAQTRAIAEAPAPPAPPDVNGFLLAAMAALGLARGNALLAAWPTFTVALGAGNWGVARLVIDAATTAETVTAEERTTLLALLEQYGIPEA
jgi:hypothetical protein